jgi:hypothetical protein
MKNIMSHLLFHDKYPTVLCQVLPDDMVALRKALLNMENRDIGCGPVGAEVWPSFS